MKPTLLALCLTLLAQQAIALSCIRPDPIDTFQRVAVAPEPYFVLYGQLTFDEGDLPPGVLDAPEGAPATILAQFRGKGLTLDGFTADYISPAVLQVTCLGPWCGAAQSGVDAIYFVRADKTPVEMEAGPCGGMIFEQPDEATLEMLVSCMRGGPCRSVLGR